MNEAGSTNDQGIILWVIQCPGMSFIAAIGNNVRVKAYAPCEGKISVHFEFDFAFEYTHVHVTQCCLKEEIYDARARLVPALRR